MITKINVPKTSIVIEIENKEIKIENMIGYDMKMVFRNQDAEPSTRRRLVTCTQSQYRTTAYL